MVRISKMRWSAVVAVTLICSATVLVNGCEDPVVARADVTWRDEKDAVAMTRLPAKAARSNPKLAALMEPLRITARGRVSTFTARMSSAEALKMAQIIPLLFLRGDDSRSASASAPASAPAKTAPSQEPAARARVRTPSQRPSVARPAARAPSAAP
jgi:hypothetical protein